jgi:hypothetical protein
MLTNTHIQILSNVYNIYYLITNILKFIYIYIYIYIDTYTHTRNMNKITSWTNEPDERFN